MHFTRSAIGILALSLSSNIAQAQLLDLGFSPITSNNTENIADQLSASAYDKSQALTDFGTGFSQINTMKDHSSDNSGITEVLFTFSNNVGIESSISEIYFDDGTIFDQTDIINSMSGSTAFSGGTIKPGELPSGNNLSPAFVATAGFGIDAQGNPNKGVSSSTDMVGIIIQLQNDVTFTDLQDALVEGTLRLGLHVRSIGSAGGSDSFVNNPLNLSNSASAVPLPAAAWLFGPALLAVAGNIRRKKSV